jgi:hypothetical protein
VTGIVYGFGVACCSPHMRWPTKDTAGAGAASYVGWAHNQLLSIT